MTAPTIAFVLFKYFPYGGLQRDFLRIALRCQALGARVRVHTLAWQGDVPAGFEVNVAPVRALTNHRRYAKFALHLATELRARPADAVIGFNRLPGLDWYFAADPCFVERAAARGAWYRATPRYRHFAGFERAVFERGARTRVMLLAEAQRDAYVRRYGTPEARLVLLPPGIAADRRAGPDAAALRASVRAEFDVPDDGHLLLFVGSGFRIKGLARALHGLAALPAPVRERTRLLAIGNDRADAFRALARRLGVADRALILPGRDDVPRLLQGADLLLHPAHAETAGMVLLEAVVAGLPVLTTDVCGYAGHVLAADAGVVLPSPFVQSDFDATLARMLGAPERKRWCANGIAYGAREDLYGMADRAAALIMAGAERAWHVPAA